MKLRIKYEPNKNYSFLAVLGTPCIMQFTKVVCGQNLYTHSWGSFGYVTNTQNTEHMSHARFHY